METNIEKNKNNTTDYQKEFLDWLEKNPKQKKSLTGWKDFAKIIDNGKTIKTKTLEIDFSQAISLSRRWRDVKNRFLEYWKTFYWWVVTEKHDFSLGYSFQEWDYFIRHYQNSTEELVVQIKQLKVEKERLESEVAKLKEELDIEQETNQESAEVMDNFYRRQFIENQTPNVLEEFSTDYLTLNQENKQKEQEIKQLKGTIETVKKIIEKECQIKEIQQKGNLKTALDLAEQLIANLKVQEEQTEAQIQINKK